MAGGQGGDPVEGARVQKVVAQLRCQGGGQRALARGSRAVDANHRQAAHRSMGHGKQLLKIIGKGFGDAFGVFDAHWQPGRVKSRQRETHGHAVVVIGVDAGRAPVGRCGWGGDAQKVAAFFHRSAELAQFGSHGGQAVGLFYPPTGDVAQGGGAAGIERHDGQRHGSIWNMVAVEVYGFEWPALAGFAALDGQVIRTALYSCTHQAGCFGEADVALDRVGP